MCPPLDPPLARDFDQPGVAILLNEFNGKLDARILHFHTVMMQGNQDLVALHHYCMEM